MSSDARELSGVKLTVKAGLEHFRNRVVLVETDNKVTQAYINYLGGRSVFLNSIAGGLWSMCYRAHILLVAVHGLGKAHVRADRLSRTIVSPAGSTITLTSVSSRRSSRSSTVGTARTQWTSSQLGTTDCSIVMCRGGPARRQSPSMHSCSCSRARTRPASPPVACIPRLLREVLRRQVTVTVVAPNWQAAWRPDLNRLLLEPPLRLPNHSI